MRSHLNNCVSVLTLEGYQMILVQKYCQDDKQLELGRIHLSCIQQRIWYLQGDKIDFQEKENWSSLAKMPVCRVGCTENLTKIVLASIQCVVNVLYMKQQVQLVYSIVEKQAMAWIKYLKSYDKTSAENYYDKFFRLLWKCASLMEKKNLVQEALQFRTLALKCMKNGRTFDTNYAVQQIFRSGVHACQLAAHDEQHTKWVVTFYRNADVLFSTDDEPFMVL